MSDQQNQSTNLRAEIKEKTTGYIIGALGLVAGLAWNEAIKSLIDVVFPLSKNSLLAKFVYAILITFVIVSLSAYLIRLASKAKS